MKKTRKKHPLDFNDPNFYMKRFLRMYSEEEIKESINNTIPLIGRNGQISPAINVSSSNHNISHGSIGFKK